MTTGSDADKKDERKRRTYQILSLMLDNALTFDLAPSYRAIADELEKKPLEEQWAMLEELQPYAPRKVTADQVVRKFERFIDPYLTGSFWQKCP